MGVSNVRLSGAWALTTFVFLTVIYFGLALMHLLGGRDLMPAWGPAVVAALATVYAAVAASKQEFAGAPQSLRRGHPRSILAYLAVALVVASAVLMANERRGAGQPGKRAPGIEAALVWVAAMLPVGLLALSVAGLWKRGAFGSDRPVLVAKKSLIARRRASRQELLETVFHGFVTLLVELVALACAFIFYLSREAQRALERPVLNAVYNDNRDLFAGAYHAALRDVCEAAEGPLPLLAAQRPLPDAPPPAVPSACCAAGIPDAAASVARTLLRAIEEPDPRRNDTATQNRWVFRTTLLYVGMAVVAFVVAYAVNRLAGGPRVNIPSIVRYNVVLLAIALGLQVAFMFLVTLRYVPIKPSEQWVQLRAALDGELDRAAGKAGGEEGTAAAGDEDLQVVPTPALWRNAVLVAFLALTAAAVWFAWRSKAFQSVTFAQSVVVQSFFIGAIMTGMYFTLSQSVARDVQGVSMASVARSIAAPVRGDAEAAEALRREAAGVLDGLDREAAAMDEAVRRRNAEVLHPFLRIAVAFVAVLLVVLAVSTGGRLLTRKFWVALLAVGMVGGATSITVEFGFLQNVFRNFRPLNAGRLVNKVAARAAESVGEHSRWYCAQGCPGAGRCCAEGPAACGRRDIWPPLQVD
jgi:hypothetical protein